MSETQHTPGPWFVWDKDQPDEHYDEAVVYSGVPTVHTPGRLVGAGPQVCRCESSLDIEDEDDANRQTIANARLIAAAPDLLAALEHIAHNATPISPDGPHQDYITLTSEDMDVVVSAIAKATK